MKKLSMMLIVLILVAMLVPMTAGAQEGRISYGETVSGEITDAAYEIPYTFKGNEGEFIHVHMEAVDPINGPEIGIVLTDASNATVALVEGFFKQNDLFFPLPATGEYTILATRRESRAGTTVGEYNLTLNLLPVVDKDFTEN